MAERSRSVISTPSKRTVPLVGRNSRRIARPVVVLPLPDSPTRPSTSPGLTVRLTSFTACRTRAPDRLNRRLPTGNVTPSPVASTSGAVIDRANDDSARHDLAAPALFAARYDGRPRSHE